MTDTAISQPAPAEAPATETSALTYQVFNTSVTSMAANMTLILGKEEAILVDAPFSRADAHRVVAEILDSGKRLTTIFVTHDHPDHFFGLDVILDAFPDARAVAHPVVVADMTRSVPIKFERWSPLLGANAPVRQVVPTAIDADGTLKIEGHKLQVLGPMQGDHVHATTVWDPDSRTLIAGDVAFNLVFPWLGEHLGPQYDAWLEAIDAMKALQPARLIPGHTKPGLTDDSEALDWTRRYIETFEAESKVAGDSATLAARMYALYPDTIDVAGGFLVGVSSQVGTGEIEPWDE
ncbi:MBL fold metallo-hydrolase [Sphingomonas sp. H39-1-10]|uniref:MBL fold metallo-hydrolase n=1 Tax=Sphingomonas pollutisoli TaxID=3030829 RepID=UPI0023B8D26C|nr:MBL fold metallo-hydrolase [Sphingomonas pollutisoli]MDF0491412.1 MBL fold metallo-hydrolase [Sphingomonas pollutisoli]